MLRTYGADYLHVTVILFIKNNTEATFFILRPHYEAELDQKFSFPKHYSV